jgi:diaminohydroxyphosphoribosylaminopyrimidine deaminase / 5-amino-6-(5-phosphoribosylamino)uracil reductase
VGWRGFPDLDLTMSHDAMMRRALALAEAGWGRVHPNPLVGAVVVRDGVVAGEGAHREFGGPHAEIEALRAAGEKARGATLYVTLEPCAHHGKTPPCTDAVVEAGVRRVVFATEDPDPAAAGGATVLAAAGLEVTAGIEREAARRQNALFLVPTERGRPFLALKYGLSLDGRIARAEGERTRVTGPAAEAEVHRLRAGFDAILVGGRTARTDDPRLTARGAVEPRVPPVRVVVSAAADLPLDSRLVATARQTPVWVVAASDAPPDAVEALEEHGVRVLQAGTATSERVLDPGSVVDRLAVAGVRTILCEGGGRLGAALLEARLVDRMYLFHAPVLYGAGGVPGFPAAAMSFEGSVVEVRQVGADTLTIVERSG